MKVLRLSSSGWHVKGHCRQEVSFVAVLFIGVLFAIPASAGVRTLAYSCVFEKYMSESPYLCGPDSGFEMTDRKFRGSVILTTQSTRGLFRFQTVVTYTLPVVSCSGVAPVSSETLPAKLYVEKKALRITTTRNRLMRIKRPVEKVVSAALYVNREQMQLTGCSHCPVSIPGICTKIDIN